MPAALAAFPFPSVVPAPAPSPPGVLAFPPAGVFPAPAAALLAPPAAFALPTVFWMPAVVDAGEYTKLKTFLDTSDTSVPV